MQQTARTPKLERLLTGEGGVYSLEEEKIKYFYSFENYRDEDPIFIVL